MINSPLTVSPAVELRLQLLDGLLHGLVLLLLLLVLPLPLLGGQLQVDGRRVADGLGAATPGSNPTISIFTHRRLKKCVTITEMSEMSINNTETTVAQIDDATKLQRRTRTRRPRLLAGSTKIIQVIWSKSESVLVHCKLFAGKRRSQQPSVKVMITSQSAEQCQSN